MNINRVRTLLVLVNLGLAAGTGFTVYKEFEQKDARRKQTEKFRDDLAAELKARPPATRSDTVRVSIKDQDLVDMTGDMPKAPEPPRPESVATSRTLTPLKELIKVITISYHPDMTIANASIMKKADVQAGPERSMFRVGDTIPFANDALVVEIRPKEVVFMNGTELEALPVPDQPTAGPGGATSSRPGTPGDPGNRPFATYVQSKKDSTIVTITSGGDRALEREGENVLEGVSFSTTEAPGGAKALRVDKVPANSVLAQHGVQDGDTLISVDNVPMSSKSEVVAYAKKNKNKGTYDVVIMRQGRRINKRVIIER
jgi:hypothetical protein